MLTMPMSEGDERWEATHCHTARFDWEFISLCRVKFQYDAIDFYRLAASVVDIADDIGQYYVPSW